MISPTVSLTAKFFNDSDAGDGEGNLERNISSEERRVEQRLQENFMRAISGVHV